MIAGREATMTRIVIPAHDFFTGYRSIVKAVREAASEMRLLGAS